MATSTSAALRARLLTRTDTLPEGVRQRHSDGTPANLIDLIHGPGVDWQNFANCQSTDPEAFFPEKGQPGEDARRICRNCIVRADCLEYALAADEQFGVWGGMTERERRRLKRRAGD